MSDAAYAAIDRGAAAVAEIVKRGEPAYGVNTGFGRLAQTHIPNDQLELLQSNLVLSHAVGVGVPLPARGGAADAGAQDRERWRAAFPACAAS